jgi:hypothetical protein
MTPKDSEVDRRDKVTIARPDGRRRHGDGSLGFFVEMTNAAFRAVSATRCRD